MLLRRHRGAILADFLRFYRATPFDLWRSGMHLLDVARLAEHLPPDGAVARSLDPEHEWNPLLTQAAVEVVNELRLLRASLTGASKSPALIERPSTSSAPGGDGSSGDVLGASDGFESLDEARDWYLARFPDMADRI